MRPRGALMIVNRSPVAGDFRKDPMGSGIRNKIERPISTTLDDRGPGVYFTYRLFNQAVYYASGCS